MTMTEKSMTMTLTLTILEGLSCLSQGKLFVKLDNNF